MMMTSDQVEWFITPGAVPVGSGAGDGERSGGYRGVGDVGGDGDRDE